MPPPVQPVEDAAVDGLDDSDAGDVPDQGLDPEVKFTWTETLSGIGTCKPGLYVGGFECDLPGIGGLPYTISGEIAFRLVGSAEQQMLTVEMGSIDGSFFTAPNLLGGLDCNKDEFSAASLDGFAVLVANGTFSVSLNGAFDDQALSIEGAFQMINELNETCDGTFRVGIAP